MYPVAYPLRLNFAQALTDPRIIPGRNNRNGNEPETRLKKRGSRLSVIRKMKGKRKKTKEEKETHPKIHIEKNDFVAN